MRAFIFFLLCVALVLQFYLFSEHYLGERTAPSSTARDATAAPPASLPPTSANPVRGIEILRGSVVNDAGVPVDRAEVTVVETNLDQFDPFNMPRSRDTWTASTGPDGTFTLDTLAPGGYVVMAQAPQGSALATAVLEARGAAGEVALRLAPGRRVEGIVTTLEGQPIEGANVFLLSPTNGPAALTPFRYVPATTGSDGRFAMDHLPPLPAAFLAVAKNFAPALIRERDALAGDLAPLKFQLGHGARVAGYLVESEGGRLADKSSVVLREVEFGLEVYRKRTADAASFLFQDVRPATYEIMVDSPKYALASRPLLVNARESHGNIDVTVVRAGRIKGKVVRGDGRDGIEGVRVAAVSEEAETESMARTSASGQYSIDGLPPGTYVLSIREQGVFRAEGDRSVRVEGGRTVEGPMFRAETGTAVSGRVLDAEGRPAPGANVYLSLTASATPDQSIRAGADGRFELTGIPVGSTVRVWANHLGHASVALGPERLTATGLQGLTFTLNLAASGLIAGHVVDSLGHPVAGARVLLYSPDPSLAEPLSAQSGADGLFQFEGLIDGAYRMSADNGGGSASPSPETQVEILNGARIDGLKLTLP